MATALGCQPYHSTYEEKDESLAAWMDGQEKTIVATSALGTGIDTDGVTAIVHLGRPHGIVDFVQEVGRAGRKGELVQSTVVVGRREMEGMQPKDYTNADPNQEGLGLFLTSQRCRRLVLSEFMDGKGVDCSSAQGQRCDVCRQIGDRDDLEAETQLISPTPISWAVQQQERYSNGSRL